MLTERSKVPSEQKKRDFFPAKNLVDARREVVTNARGVGRLGKVTRIPNTRATMTTSTKTTCRGIGTCLRGLLRNRIPIP